MIILAVDTSGRNGSLALARATDDQIAGGQVSVLEVVPVEGGTFSAQLVPQIAALLERHVVSKSEIGGFAVASGPGSFTGLRVGLAAIKGLAEVLNKPIATVSLLEVIARTSKIMGRVLAVLDAGRGEMYVGEYEVGAGSVRCVREDLLRPGGLSEGKAASTVVAITPDLAIAGTLRAIGFQTEEIERPRADAVARLGWERIKMGETIAPQALEANYIRRSDAEIFSSPAGTASPRR